jgi:hypothetical protein
MRNPQSNKRTSLNKAHPRTSTEIIQEQREQAKAEKAAHATAKAESTKAVVPAKPANTAVALPDHRSDLERHLDEIAPTGVTGRLLKLSKNGEIVTADDGVPIDTDTTFIALVDQVLGGYIKFDPEGVLPPERAQGAIYAGFVPPPRASLGDNDPNAWPVGLSGSKEDPWRYQFAVPLQATDTSELFTFVTSSASGRISVRQQLLDHYKRLQQVFPGEYPIVRLKVAKFISKKNPRVGPIPKPLFQVIGHCPQGSTVKPDTISIETDLGDAIPHL